MYYWLLLLLPSTVFLTILYALYLPSFDRYISLDCSEFNDTHLRARLDCTEFIFEKNGNTGVCVLDKEKDIILFNEVNYEPIVYITGVLATLSGIIMLTIIVRILHYKRSIKLFQTS